LTVGDTETGGQLFEGRHGFFSDLIQGQPSLASKRTSIKRSSCVRFIALIPRGSL
jgi:hypothetical protein